MRLWGALGAFALAASACGPVRVWYGRSPDRRHTAEVIQRGKKSQHVRLDGVAGRAFAAIGVEQLSFGAQGQLAYPARDGAGWWVVAPGATRGPYAGVGAVRWSRDGQHLAFAAQRSGKWVVIRDGEEGPALDAVFEDSLSFSKDGAHLAYAGRQNGASAAYLDGVQVGGAWDGVGGLHFGDGARLAMMARKAGEAWAVIDGAAQGPYEAIAEVALRPGPSGAVVLARREGRWRAVIDGLETEPYSALGPVRFSADGKTSALYARRRHQDQVLVNGAPGLAFDEIRPQSVAVDATGRRVAWAGRRGAAWSVSGLGADDAAWDEVGNPIFAAQGERAVFAARKGQDWALVEDGRPGPAFEWIGEPALARDGASLAFFARRSGREVLVRDGVALPVVGPVDGSLTFSADGERLGWLGSAPGDRAPRLYVDGRPGPVLDLEELIAATMQARPDRRKLALDTESLRAWVAAELALGERAP